MRRLDLYWMRNSDWYYWDEDGFRCIKEDAPEDAINSYYNYLEQIMSEVFRAFSNKGGRKEVYDAYCEYCEKRKKIIRSARERGDKRRGTEILGCTYLEESGPWRNRKLKRNLGKS